MSETTPILVGSRQRQTLIQFVWVPALFWDDHSERCPTDDPGAMCSEEKRAGRRVLVSGDARQFETLRSDAAFYAERNVDDCDHLVRSAARTLRALADASIYEPPKAR